MGRSNKQIITHDGIDRRETGYYATPSFLSTFIAESLLEAAPHAASVFDPCIGRGELCSGFLDSGLNISGVDILSQQLADGIAFEETDFISLAIEHLQEERPPLSYDIWVANPPYNCHEVDYIKNQKVTIRSVFGKSAALNMYALFLSAMIKLARPGALLGILTLDSFMTAKGYRPLREQLLACCRIRKLLLCPLDLFHGQHADVRTCYLELERMPPESTQKSPIVVLNRPATSEVFQRTLREREFTVRPFEKSLLKGELDHHEFLVDVPEDVLSLFQEPRLGELFPCVTGISTGNDKAYLSPMQREGFSIPFYKNPGVRKFYTTPDAYLTTACEHLADELPGFMMRNRQHLGLEGITCSSMGVSFSAAYRPAGAYYGVNANITVSGEDLWWLLSYLNSSLVSYLVRGVLLRSNMITSGYVARIPVCPLSPDEKATLAQLGRTAYEQQVSPEEAIPFIRQIDDSVMMACRFSADTQRHITDFVSSIVSAT